MRYLTTGRQQPTGEHALTLYNCGLYGHPERDIPTVREHGSGDYHILFAARGCIEVTLDGKRLFLHDGEAIYYPPEVPQYYCYRAGENTAYYWLHYGGSEAAAFAESCGLLPGVFSLCEPLAVTAAFRALLDNAGQLGKAATYAQNGRLQVLLATIAGQRSRAASSRYTAQIAQIATSMRTAPEEKRSCAELAVACGISECHFIRLFRKETGSTPQQYRQHALMEKAKQLLTDTELPIAEIAYVLHIDDPLYFSRLFRKLCGMSPTRYRLTVLRKNDTHP